MATSSLSNTTLTISGENLTSTILGYLNGVTSDVQTQLNTNATDISGKQASLTFGIGDTNVVKCGSGIADNDFLRINGNTLEGRSASEVLGDISAQASLSAGSNVQINNNVISATNTTYGLPSSSSSLGLLSYDYYLLLGELNPFQVLYYSGRAEWDKRHMTINTLQALRDVNAPVALRFLLTESGGGGATNDPGYNAFMWFLDSPNGYIFAWMYHTGGYYAFNFEGLINTSNGISTSDDRLKHNERTIDNALDIVMKLEAKRYLKTIKMYDASYTLIKDNSGNYTNLKDNDSVFEEIGFIAQDLLEIEDLSFVVYSDPSGNETKPYSVCYNSIFVVGMQAIQELNVSLNTEKEKVIALESKIEAQETLINSLLERVTALENN